MTERACELARRWPGALVLLSLAAGCVGPRPSLPRRMTSTLVVHLVEEADRAPEATLVVVGKSPPREPVIVDVTSPEVSLDLEPGDYSLTATSSRHAAVETRLHLEPRGRSTVSLSLEKAAFVVSGRIQLADGDKVRARPFAERVQQDGDVSLFAGKPSEQGAFSLPLPRGIYRFGAGADGYEDIVEARLPPYDGLVLDFAMAPKRQPAEESTSQWIRQTALVLPSDGRPVPEGQVLEQLCARLGGATIVGLGEATHGTREFALLRWRIFEALVRCGGFRVFLAEAGLAESRAVDDYVVHGRGDPARALGGLGYPMWRTPEAVAFIEWMRRHNLGREAQDQVRFAGVDMQSVGATVDAFVHLLEEMPGADASRTGPLIEVAQRVRSSPRGERYQAAQELLGLVQRFPPRPDDGASQQALVQLAQVACQGALMDSLDVRWSADWVAFGAVYRDQAMADNALLTMQRRFPGAKALLSAHNLHTSLSPYSSFGVPSTGHHLRAALGERYLSLGMLFGTGSFAAKPADAVDRPVPPQVFQAQEPVPGEIEHVFAAVGLPTALVDLRSAESRKLPLLRSSMLVRYHDAIVHEQPLPLVPARDHDLLLYVHRTSATLPSIPDAR